MAESLPSRSTIAFRDQFARGGGTWTMKLNQLVGAWIARRAAGWNWHPSNLTIAAMLVSIAASFISAIVLARSLPISVIVVLFGWQLAYSLDCADGQLARATNQTSESGAVLDLLCDFVMHGVVALTLCQIATVGWEDGGQVELGVFAACTWLIAPYWEAVSARYHQTGTSPGAIRRVVREIRDFGFLTFVLPLVALFSRLIFVWMLVAVGVIHLFAFAAQVHRAARQE